MDTSLLIEAQRALKHHDIAKASGDAFAIAAAEGDLWRARDTLTRVRAEVDVLDGIAKALRAPRRLGSL